MGVACMQGRAMREKHLQFNKARMSIWECCELLNECVDDSDPDLEEPQIQHLLQTAEAIRLDFPDDDWFHLVGLIHGTTRSLIISSILRPPAFQSMNSPCWPTTRSAAI